MKTFITWSGLLSQGVALEIRNLLRLVFPNVEPFVSWEDIRKGEQWQAAVAGALATSQRGIICLTTDNYNQPWVLFEAGVLTKALQCPVLYTVLIDDLKPSTLEGSPLSQFQHTRLERTDMLRLLKQINSEIGVDNRTDADLDNLFDKLWPDMESAVFRLLRSTPRRTIKITDLVGESLIIAGQVFRNSVIEGPAILAFLEGNSFDSCVFPPVNNVESLLWTAMNPDAASGAIGLTRCHFENCEFRRIGVTGSPQTLEDFRRAIKAKY